MDLGGRSYWPSRSVLREPLKSAKAAKAQPKLWMELAILRRRSEPVLRVFRAVHVGPNPEVGESPLPRLSGKLPRFPGGRQILVGSAAAANPAARAR